MPHYIKLKNKALIPLSVLLLLFSSACEECDVGETVRARLLNWLESADPEHVNWDHRGERIFRYDAPSDTVVMSYYGPGGDMLEARWPWNDAFFALYEWDMMC